MRKLIIAAIILFVIPTQCFADFRFAVMGDTRGDNSDGINIKVMKAILEKIKSENVDFILITGDMITGSAKSDVHRNRLRKWKGIIERYKIPFYASIGNHEIESELSENIVRSVLEMPENGPAGLKELAYSFGYKNAHFAAIDTDIFNNFHAIGETQMSWLKEDLEKNQDKLIFIFGHEPAYPLGRHTGTSLDKYAAGRDQLWDEFKKYKVAVYFCGHEHLYDKSLHEGVYQVITAGGGAPMYAPKEKGGFYHFVVVDVKDNGSAVITVKDIEGKARDVFNIEN
ncbi:MAG: metallophosphoesterase [Candidatus Omnitrophota bacterium]|nr:metallophosphoesterase [Candidatus Omnitrophota bacterium]